MGFEIGARSMEAGEKVTGRGLDWRTASGKSGCSGKCGKLSLGGVGEK